MAAKQQEQERPVLQGLSSLHVGLVGRYALAGAICATAGHTALVPMDVIKTRMQGSPGMYAGVGAAAKHIVKSEGAGALLLGLAPTFVRATRYFFLLLTSAAADGLCGAGCLQVWRL